MQTGSGYLNALLHNLQNGKKYYIVNNWTFRLLLFCCGNIGRQLNAMTIRSMQLSSNHTARGQPQQSLLPLFIRIRLLIKIVINGFVLIRALALTKMPMLTIFNVHIILYIEQILQPHSYFGEHYTNH